jgi:hypothetical protein
LKNKIYKKISILSKYSSIISSVIILIISIYMLSNII